MTPLGSLVDPEVYWIIARESGDGSNSVQRPASAPARSSVASHGIEAACPVVASKWAIEDAVLGAWRSPWERRLDGNGDAAGVKNAEQCRDEFEAGWVGKNDALARKAHVLQASRDRA